MGKSVEYADSDVEASEVWVVTQILTKMDLRLKERRRKSLS
ncbi:hypothetical protein OROHE_025191 [Orobanche hederae]